MLSEPKRSKPTSRNVFPLRRPSEIWLGAGTVLAVKGPLRRAAPLTAQRRPGRTPARRAAPAGTLADLHRRQRPAYPHRGGKPA